MCTCSINACVYSEAEYAASLQKPTLSLLLEEGYKPDGWLGPLCLNDLLFDFSVEQKFNDEWSKLHAKLTEMKLTNTDTGLSIGHILASITFTGTIGLLVTVVTYIRLP